MKKRTFVITIVLATILALIAAAVFYPQSVTFGFLGEEVGFVRQFNFTELQYEYCNSGVCLKEGDFIIGVKEDRMFEYYLEKGVLHSTSVFSGPIYEVSGGTLVEVGYRQANLIQTIEDDESCVLFEQIMPGSCYQTVVSTQWYDQ